MKCPHCQAFAGGGEQNCWRCHRPLRAVPGVAQMAVGYDEPEAPDWSAQPWGEPYDPAKYRVDQETGQVVPKDIPRPPRPIIPLILMIAFVAGIVTAVGYIGVEYFQDKVVTSPTESLKMYANGEGASAAIKDESFSIEFPAEAKKSEETVESSGVKFVVTSYRVQYKGQAFAARKIEIGDTIDPDDLPDAVDGLTSQDVLVEDTEAAELDGLDAEEVFGTKTNQEVDGEAVHERSRYAQNGYTLYIVAVSSTSKDIIGFARFADSFKLK